MNDRNLDNDTIPWSGFKNVKIPALEGERYKVVGMGEAGIYPDTHYFIIPCGASHDYKISPDKTFNQLIKKTLESSGERWSF